jgi:hypothetical protein
MGLVETVPYMIQRFVGLSIVVKLYITVIHVALPAQKNPLCPFSLGVGPFVPTLQWSNLLGTFIDLSNLPCSPLEDMLFKIIVRGTV